MLLIKKSLQLKLINIKLLIIIIYKRKKQKMGKWVRFAVLLQVMDCVIFEINYGISLYKKLSEERFRNIY